MLIDGTDIKLGAVHFQTLDQSIFTGVAPPGGNAPVLHFHEFSVSYALVGCVGAHAYAAVNVGDDHPIVIGRAQIRPTFGDTLEVVQTGFEPRGIDKQMGTAFSFEAAGEGSNRGAGARDRVLVTGDYTFKSRAVSNGLLSIEAVSGAPDGIQVQAFPGEETVTSISGHSSDVLFIGTNGNGETIIVAARNADRKVAIVKKSANGTLTQWVNPALSGSRAPETFAMNYTESTGLGDGAFLYVGSCFPSTNRAGVCRIPPGDGDGTLASIEPVNGTMGATRIELAGSWIYIEFRYPISGALGVDRVHATNGVRETLLPTNTTTGSLLAVVDAGSWHYVALSATSGPGSRSSVANVQVHRIASGSGAPVRVESLEMDPTASGVSMLGHLGRILVTGSVAGKQVILSFPSGATNASVEAPGVLVHRTGIMHGGRDEHDPPLNVTLLTSTAAGAVFVCNLAGGSPSGIGIGSVRRRLCVVNATGSIEELHPGAPYVFPGAPFEPTGMVSGRLPYSR